MSALPPKVDIGQRGRDVRFVPKADSCTAAKGIVIRSPCRRELLTVVIADDETGVLFFDDRGEVRSLCDALSCDALHALTLTCETDSAANWLSAPLVLGVQHGRGGRPSPTGAVAVSTVFP